MELMLSNFRRLTGWPMKVTTLTSVGFVADGSFYFLGNFCRFFQADGSCLNFIGADGS
jgi:hypothetical protein